MRRGMKPEVVKDGDKVVGFFTSADFCAEHECGIKDLRNMIAGREVDVTADDCKTFGIANRLIDAASFQANSLFVKGKDYAILVVRHFGHWDTKEEYAKHLLSKERNAGYRDLPVPKRNEPDAINAAWSERDLGISVGRKHAKDLEAIYKACCEGFGFLGTSRQLPVFDNGGLVLADSRLIPVEHIAKMEEADRDAHKLHVAARATGIKAKIDAHNKSLGGGYSRHTWGKQSYAVLPDGTKLNEEHFDKTCGYFALSPGWNIFKNEDGSKAKPTKYDVVFWLNPMNQQQNAAMWATVEDLEAWMRGEGPIPGFGSGRDHILRTREVAAGNVDKLWSDEVYCKDCDDIVNKRNSHGHRVDGKCAKCHGTNIVKSKEREYV